MKYDSAVKFSKYEVTLQTRLVALITITVLVISVIGVFFDYHREYKRHFNVILSSLQEQARALKVAHTRITEAPVFAELEQAQRIQTNLLPVSQPIVSGLSIVAEYHLSKHIAGDLYDIFSLPDDRTAAVILDVYENYPGQQ